MRLVNNSAKLNRATIIIKYWPHYCPIHHLRVKVYGMLEVC
jgi:hypothetical protein